jgi:predicted metal-dependent phosphoesterase TrpH
MCVDLHTHSFYSDGTVSPAGLISMAAASGLTGFALTDHDTVEGVPEAQRLGQEQGLNVVSGLEISAKHGDISVHILGYGVDPEHPQLNAWLTRIQEGRKERNRHILDKLAALGITISMEELEQFSGCGQTGRPHIARLLIAKGHVKHPNQAFARYLGRNKAAWHPRFACSAAECIAIIHQAGGAAVLAHPGLIDPALKKQPQLIQELAERNMDGVEAHYPKHSRQMTELFSSLARRHKLLITGGSDYHGDSRINGLAGPATGFCPPDSIMEQLCGRLHAASANPDSKPHPNQDHADHTCC